MVNIRVWQPGDLPYLERMAAITTWEITPDDDKAHTRFDIVARNAANNVRGVLSSPGGTAFVAEEGGIPVGYLLVGVRPQEFTGEPFGYLADIYVFPQYRRRGISKRFHQLADDYLRRLGLRKVTNWTHAHNGVGQNTITSHGHKVTGVLMVKELRPAATAPSAVLQPVAARR